MGYSGPTDAPFFYQFGAGKPPNLTETGNQALHPTSMVCYNSDQQDIE